MNTSLQALPAVILAITGCSFTPDDPANVAAERKLTRHIEIEVEDLDRGLPCRVVDRRAPDARDVLWSAEYEAGFCRQKAEETRHVLQARGWACRPESADERRKPTLRPASPPYIVAAWRCLEGLRPLQRLIAASPPKPTLRPDEQRSPEVLFGNELLRAAVVDDLSVIGQNGIGDGTIVDAALGDLDRDGIEDAIVVLKRGAAHHMLMAYLQNGEAYNLVDVMILKASDTPGDDKIDLTIKDGAVHLGNCCEGQTGPTVLKLDNRKLAYADGG